MIPYARFPTNAFHVFRKILIPYSRLQECIRQDLQDFSGPVFSTIYKVFDFLTSPKIFVEGFCIFLSFLKYLGVCKVGNNWSWESWTRPDPKSGFLSYFRGFSTGDRFFRLSKQIKNSMSFHSWLLGPQVQAIHLWSLQST